MKAILWVVALVTIVGSGWWIYNRQFAGKGFGDVTNRDGSPLQNERMETGAMDGDGKPGTTADRASDRSEGMIAPAAASSQPIQPPAAEKAVVVSASTAAVPPTTDSMSPAAPNGLAFAGAGKFQWYRQGNLTWRLNTESGNTCVAFATIDEWKNPLVARHGCGTA